MIRPDSIALIERVWLRLHRGHKSEWTIQPFYAEFTLSEIRKVTSLTIGNREVIQHKFFMGMTVLFGIVSYSDFILNSWNHYCVNYISLIILRMRTTLTLYQTYPDLLVV